MKLKNSSFHRHIFQLWRFLVLVSLSFGTHLLYAEGEQYPRAQDLINDMSRAGRELNYDGIFVYKRDSRMDTMRLIHKADANGEFERMISLTGPAREVIRDNESVTCIFPDNQEVMIEKSRPRKFLSSKLPEPIEKIADYYSFSVAGTDRVAGHKAWVVNIIPRDEFRYGYQLWIDTKTSLLLKSELKDIVGRPVEQILFTQLQVKEHIPDKLLQPDIEGEGYTWYEGSSEEMPIHSATHIWTVIDMPAGFRMSDYEKQTVAEDIIPVEHLVYSDGLATVSVFIEKISNSPDAMRGASNMGGVNAFAMYMKGYQVTAVGEVPQKTVQLMANSVIRNQ